MAATISFRHDSESDAALAYLEREVGLKRSEAIRRALVELAERERRSALRQEVGAVAADPADRAEARAILEEMEELGAEPPP
ncbi:MAG: hypothetical protein ACRDL3_01900 [Solirubrobacterales bacterium]